MNGIEKITARIDADTQAEIDRSVRLLAEQAWDRIDGGRTSSPFGWDAEKG